MQDNGRIRFDQLCVCIVYYNTGNRTTCKSVLILSWTRPRLQGLANIFNYAPNRSYSVTPRRAATTMT